MNLRGGPAHLGVNTMTDAVIGAANDALMPIHEAQVITYMRLVVWKVGC